MFANKYVTALKREQRRKYFETERIIANVCEKFIIKRNLILYGGKAIDKWICKVTNGKQRIYNHSIDKIDYDCFSLDYDNDSKDLAAELINAGLQNIRIVSNITGSTRKIFIDLDPDAYIDVSDVGKAIHFSDFSPEEKYRHLEPSTIDGILVANPHFLKIDQYANLCVNLFIDYVRIPKAFSRLTLLEHHFPIVSDMNIREILSDVKPNVIQGIHDIYTGDLAINYLLFNRLLGNYEKVELKGPSFYIPANIPLTDETIRLATHHMVLWDLYKKRFGAEDTIEIDAKISSLLKKHGLEFGNNFKVLIPQQSPVNNISTLPTFFVNKIKGQIVFKQAEKLIKKKPKNEDQKASQ